MSLTPTKSNEFTHCFTSKELVSPNKDNTEISKTIFIHVSSLRNLLSNWLKLVNKGTKICKSISSLKLYECTEYYYPHPTKALTESLLEALEGLKNVVDGIEILNNQLQALATLQPGNSPVIFTWSALQISENVSNIFISIQKEFALKLAVTENIAHCRDESLMEVYVSSWEFDVYLNIESNEYLFAEIGLPGIT